MEFKFEKLPWYYQSLIVLGVLLVLDYAVYFNFLSGQKEQIAQLEAKIQDLSLRVEKQRAVEQRLAAFEAEIAKDQRKLELLRAILPEAKETPEIVRKVQEMAADSNLIIRKFAPQPVMAKGFYSDWPIAMELDGNYFSLSEFFERIARFTRIINVDNINITGVSQPNEPGVTLSATCTATTFVYQPSSGEEQARPGQQNQAK